MRIDRFLSLLALAVFSLLAGAGVAQTADNPSIAKGEYLARAGDCIACHTKSRR